MLKNGIRIKSNPILKYGEVLKAMSAVDGIFLDKSNKYGYVTNLKHPDVLAEYQKYCKARNAKILGDEERFYFDTLMIKKHCPQLAEKIEAYEQKAGSSMIRLVSFASYANVSFYYDEPRKGKDGKSECWLVVFPDAEEQTKYHREWISDGRVAVMRYTEEVYAYIYRRFRHNIVIPENLQEISTISEDSGTGVKLCFKNGRKSKDGNKPEEWQIADDTSEQWFSYNDNAAKEYADRIYTLLFRRINKFYLKTAV